MIGFRVLAVTAVAGLAAVALGACAQPGQLGHPLTEPAADPAPAPTAGVPSAPPAPVAPQAGLLSSGLVGDPVTIRSTGPAQFSVRTIVLAPGESTSWQRHPGTELSLVRSGEVTVQRAEACGPTTYGAGDGLFVADAEAHVLRNDGAVPAELVVTRLLAPGAPGEEDVDPAC